MRKQIPLIIVATFAIAILFSQSFLIKPAMAQAFNVISGFAYPIKAIHYQAETDSFWVLTATTTRTILYQVDRSTQSIIGTFNHTLSMNNRVAVDLWCGKTDCFITTGSGGIASQLLRISTEDISPNIFAGENVTGTYTYTVTTTSTTGFGHLTGRDAVTGGFGSITIWIDSCVDAGCNTHRPWIVDGISMTSPGFLPSEQTGTQVKVHDLQWSGIEGIVDNDLAIVTGGLTAGTQSELIIYSLSTLATKCQVTIPDSDLGLSLATNYIEGGDANNKIYVSVHNGIVYVFNDTCVLQDTITSSETGLTGEIRYTEYDSGRVFMQESGANAIISQMLTNSTGHIIDTSSEQYLPLPSVAQTTFDTVFTTLTLGDMVLQSGFGRLWYPYTGTEQELGILTFDTAPDDEPPTTGVDCDLPENANILICRLGGDGTLGSAGAFVIGNTTQGTGILGIGCSIGLVDCTEDPNPQTNGLGLLIFIASIFVIVGMFYRSLGAQATFQLPVFLWVIIIVALSAFFTITGIIDPVFLILSIVAVIALAVPKVIGVIQNRSFGGGGSTE